jgi:hypothetical protein
MHLNFIKLKLSEWDLEVSSRLHAGCDCYSSGLIREENDYLHKLGSVSNIIIMFIFFILLEALINFCVHVCYCIVLTYLEFYFYLSVINVYLYEYKMQLVFEK